MRGWRLADLRDDCARVVFRVVSEAIVNTEKHAKASTLRVHLYRSGRPARLVRARTMGSGPHRRRRHAPARSAWSGMQEQATAIGGSLDFGPAPGGGMKVCLRIPLEYCHEH